MRNNQPVTRREFDYADDATLMSVTDIHSHISYANAAFVAVSGFQRDEVIGQPHNIVRHPDMPKEAFADMWATLKGGESWSALVKNRRKNGDHYWVRANATPVRRNGRLVGYMSVRTKPTRAEVAAAEPLYRDLRDGKARGRALHKGLVVRAGLLTRALSLRTLSVRWRIRCGSFANVAIVVGACAAAGLGVNAVGIVAAASAEQSAGVAQVGEAVSLMDQATQKNAALVEQGAAAAESLKQQAQLLLNAVAAFEQAPSPTMDQA